jgi:hypothetical protein
MLEFTGEPFSAIVVALTALITAIGAIEIRKGYKSGKKGDPENDVVKQVLSMNATTHAAMLDQFRLTRDQFTIIASKLDQTNNHLKDIERVQLNIHSELIRGSSSRGSSYRKDSGN